MVALQVASLSWLTLHAYFVFHQSWSWKDRDLVLAHATTRFGFVHGGL